MSNLHARLASAKRALEVAQNRMRMQAQGKRRSVTCAVGDWVLLSTKNLRPATGVKKLMPSM